MDGQDPASAVVEHAQQNVLAKRRKTGEEAMMKKRGGAAAAGGGKNGTNDAAGAKDDDVKDDDDDDASKEGDTLQLANCQLRNISAKLKSMEGRLTKPPKKAKLSKYKTQMSAADAAEVAGRAVAEAPSPLVYPGLSMGDPHRIGRNAGHTPSLGCLFMGGT